MLKIAATLTAIGLSLCLVTAADAAKPPGGGHPGGGGGHPPGGGGGGHPGGGAPHFAPPHFAAPHFSGGHPGGAPHFAGRRPGGGAHVSLGHARGGGPRVAHFDRPSFHAGVSRGRGPTPRISHLATPRVGHPAAGGGRLAGGSHARLAADPKAFAARRHFAANAAFRPFLSGGWHPYHHLGWVGPWFWPYAYGDVFYYALWPADYWDYDPFWVYGYGDIYAGIFSPYSYDEYVQGPDAPARMTALTQQIAQSCSDEAAEVTGWPIDQIQDAVKPNQQQTALLDDLGNAVVKASEEIKSHCPTSVSFTPTGRLDEMQQRLQGLVQAVNIVSPPLTKFYDSLNDEQKARFNDIGTNGPGAQPTQASKPANPQTECDASVMAWPTDQIDREVHPTDAQRAKLHALQSAAANAANAIKTACPSEIPSTPPARLAAVGKHLQAMLQAVQTIRPALDDFYNSLTDDQKARFNTMGRQLFAAK
jgi:LTXXQ motif family protein